MNKHDTPFARMVSWIDVRFRAAVAAGHDWSILLLIDDDTHHFTKSNVADLAKAVDTSPSPAVAMLGIALPEGPEVVLTSIRFEDGEWHSMLPQLAMYAVADSLSGSTIVHRKWHEQFPSSPYDRIVEDENGISDLEFARRETVDIGKYKEMLQFLMDGITESGTFVHVSVIHFVDDVNYSRIHLAATLPEKKDSLKKILKTKDVLGAQILLLTPRDIGNKTHNAAVAIISPEFPDWIGLSRSAMLKMKKELGPLSYHNLRKYRLVDWENIVPQSPAVPVTDIDGAPRMLCDIRERLQELLSNMG
jgi:hypothetical protein